MKKRIILVSLILITLLVLALPASMVAAAPEAPAPAPAPVLTAASETSAMALPAAPAPALDLAMLEAGIVTISVVENPMILVSDQETLLYGSVAGLILATIVAMVVSFRRRYVSSQDHLNADTRSPGSGGNLISYVPGG